MLSLTARYCTHYSYKHACKGVACISQPLASVIVCNSSSASALLPFCVSKIFFKARTFEL